MSRFCTLVALGAISLSAVGAPKVKDPPKTPATPEGRWKFEQHVQDGVARDGRSTEGYVIVITRTTAVLEELGQPIITEEFVYRVTAAGGESDSKDPAGGLKKAIWKVDDDTLTICESAPGGDRPTDYTAPRGSNRSLFVLKRLPK